MKAMLQVGGGLAAASRWRNAELLLASIPRVLHGVIPTTLQTNHRFIVMELKS